MAEEETAKAEWLRGFPAWLEPRCRPSKAILAALPDIALGDHAGSLVWCDVDGEEVTVYVAEPGWLHRLSGQREPFVEPGKQGEPEVSTCEYRPLRLTRRATFALSLTTTTSGYAGQTVRRHWTFDFGNDERLSLESPEHLAQPDPSDFARGLAELITKARGGPEYRP